MPRYEFTQGTSSKFWEIVLEGTSFTTTYGRIGTDGKSTGKSFPSEEKARKEYEKMIASKTKKGYELVGGEEATEETTAGGALRFEFSQGTSSKFWEIMLEGSSFTTSYGRIGAEGKSTTKDFDSPAKAQKAYEKAIASKTKKGYEQVGGGGGAAPAAARAGGKGKKVQAILGLEKESEKLASEHVKKFVFRRVVQFKKKPGLSQAAKGAAYRIGADDDGGSMEDTVEAVDHIAADKNASKLEALVVGVWDDEMGGGDDSKPVIEKLVEHKDALQGLKAIYLGDVVSEECEMSWIEQGDWGALLKAYPGLEHLRVNEGSGGSVKAMKHDSLRSLVLHPTLNANSIKNLCKSKLPNLEHLELWLGEPMYEGLEQVDPLMPILSGKLFPKLRYLGLRNSQIVDKVAAAVAEAPVLGRLETLDLSLGVLTDEGVEALVASPALKKLKRLDVHYHFASAKALKKLKAMGIKDLNTRQGDVRQYGDDPEDRYCAVGE